jgi:SAM-dependent methyltransferase
LLNNGCQAYPSINEVKTPNHYFDIILFNQSLEHISDPYAALESAISLLKKDGQLIISVPNFASNERRIFGMFWRHVDVPRHLFHFSPKTIEIIANRLQLNVISSRFKFWGGPGVALKMARSEIGMKAYGLLFRYIAQQFFSLIIINKNRYGQMMTFTLSPIVDTKIKEEA